MIETDLAQLLQDADLRYAQQSSVRLQIHASDMCKMDRDEALAANPHPGPYWEFMANALAHYLKEPRDVAA